MNKDKLEWDTFCFAQSLCQKTAQRLEASLYLAPSGESADHKEGPCRVSKRIFAESGEVVVLLEKDSAA